MIFFGSNMWLVGNASIHMQIVLDEPPLTGDLRKQIFFDSQYPLGTLLPEYDFRSVPYWSHSIYHRVSLGFAVDCECVL